MTKIIGIVGKISGEDNFYGVSAPYMQFFSRWGVVLPLPIVNIGDHEILDKFESLCDAFVLPGGGDILSLNYDIAPVYNYITKADPYLEYFDSAHLLGLIRVNKPIIGICRGAQTLQVAFGGKLIQNLRWHPYSIESRDQKVHEIYFTQQNDKRPTGKYEVNSLHHQGILLKELSVDLVPLALTDKTPNSYTLVEAFKHKDKPIIGIQWHPEEIYDPFAISLINSVLV